MTRTLIRLALLAASALALCGFTFRIIDDMGQLDWGNGEVEPLVVHQLMEGLTSAGPRGEPLPALAERWIARDAGREIEFRIRPGARWSDGERVCARQFVDAWVRVLSPEFASPYAHYLFDVKGARDFHFGRVKGAAQLGLAAPNCATLVVKLERPVAYFPALASNWVLFPVRLDLIAKFKSRWMDPGRLAVTGPFTLAAWHRDKELIFARNPRYWGPKPAIESLRAVVVGDDSTAVKLFEAGRLDWMRDLPYLAKPLLMSRPESRATASLISYHLGFRFGDGADFDREGRCALAAAIDKAQIPSLLNGGEVPADRVVALVLDPGEPPSAPRFDPEKARALWERSKMRGKAFELDYYAKDIHEPLAEWLQGQWKARLGADVKLARSEGKTYWSRLAQSAPQVFLSGTTARYAHPYAFLSEFISGAGGNWGRYSSPKYDSIAGLAAADSASRVSGAAVAAQQLLLAEDCAIIPLYFRRTASLLGSRWTGVIDTPTGVTYFKDVRSQPAAK